MCRLAKRRSPCGERGLKLGQCTSLRAEKSRSPCGERGLKCYKRIRQAMELRGRSPCGERGLKYSAPRRGNRHRGRSRFGCGMRLYLQKLETVVRLHKKQFYKK